MADEEVAPEELEGGEDEAAAAEVDEVRRYRCWWQPPSSQRKGQGCVLLSCRAGRRARLH